MIVPQDIIIQAIDNKKHVLENLPQVQKMNDIIDGEVRRLMKQKFPGKTVTDQDIDIAMRIMAAEINTSMKTLASNGKAGRYARQSLVARANNPKGMTVQELEKRVAQCSGFVKMMCGVANNAALMIMMDCLNKIADVRSRESYEERPYSPHPRYKHSVKAAFNNVLNEKRSYRNGLLYPSDDMIRFFNLSDMPDETRKKYGVVTNKQYFEFWEGTGALAYQKSQPLIGSLWNKFRLSMMNHGVKYPEQVAWGCVGAAVLELAVVVWERAMRSTYEALDGVLEMEKVQKIYRPFNIIRISASWRRALSELAPETATYTLDDTEERNVALGVEQLSELWVSAELPFDATIAAVNNFADDIFSTKGHAKKAMRELSEMRDNAIQELLAP